MKIGKLVAWTLLVAAGACAVTFTDYPAGLTGGGSTGGTTTMRSGGSGGAASSSTSGGTTSSSTSGSTTSSSTSGSTTSSSSSGSTSSSCDAGSCPLGDTCSVSGCSDWADWPMPNPGDAGLPNPPSYLQTGAGYVKDGVTQLLWQQPMDILNGATPPASCSAGCSQANAIAYCQKLVVQGISGWRLPTRIELVSIVDTTAGGPAINAVAFPGTPAVAFWTSSPYAPATSDGWTIDFNDGQTSASPVTGLARVRCVHP